MGKHRITIIDGYKYCPYCRSEVKVEKFGYRAHTYDNLSSWCKPCLADNAAFRRKFNEKYKVWYKRYYTPEKIRAMSQARRDREERRRKEREKETGNS